MSSFLEYFGFCVITVIGTLGTVVVLIYACCLVFALLEKSAELSPKFQNRMKNPLRMSAPHFNRYRIKWFGLSFRRWCFGAFCFIDDPDVAERGGQG